MGTTPKTNRNKPYLANQLSKLNTMNLLHDVCMKLSNDIGNQKKAIIEQRVLDLFGIEINLEEELKKEQPTIHVTYKDVFTDDEYSAVTVEQWICLNRTLLVSFYPISVDTTQENQLITLSLRYNF